MFMPNIIIIFYIVIYLIQCNDVCKGNIMKGAGGVQGGLRLGRGFWGGPPKTPREGTLVHWYPRRGGWGAEKAAFSTV